MARRSENGDLFDMEGCSLCGGGVMSVIRHDRDDGLFTFEGADIATQFDLSGLIIFSGYVGGQLVAPISSSRRAIASTGQSVLTCWRGSRLMNCV